MQIDRIRITIRERGWLDTLDLALHVLWEHGPAVLGLTLVGALPMVLLNYWLLGNPGRDLNFGDWVAYLWPMTLLTMIELPLSTALVTLYLGQALFLEKPQPRQIARDVWSCLPQLVVLQLVPRAIAGWLAAGTRGLDIPDPLRVLVAAIALVGWVPYVIWPYLNEVILLERNPLAKRGRNSMTTMRRNSALHSSYTGELLARGIGAALLALLMIASLSFAMEILVRLFFSRSDATWWIAVVWIPLATWLVASYFAVVRFLSYLDLRIRREGWEVELCLRAERARMTRQMA